MATRGSGSVLMLEFNELCPSLMRRWIDEGRLPHFRRLRAESLVYRTRAEEEAPALEPWIQWVNVHAGLAYAEHGVFHLGEAERITVPSIWDVVARHGGRAWVCGSMNARVEPGTSTLLLPDPWVNGVAPDRDLMPYFRFVQAHVTEYTNERVQLRPADYARFAAFMACHGLSPATLGAVIGQLVREYRGRSQWRRAVILDKLQFDVFRWYYRRLRPHLATFFLNSTAHFQHVYWRNMEPALFSAQPDAADQAEHRDAILFGYEEMDALVDRFLALVGPEATIVFCTALSQQPCLRYEAHGGKLFYRPRQFDTLFRFAGVAATSVAPAMSEQFHVVCASEADARAAARRLASLRVDGRPAMAVEVDGQTIFTGCSIFDPLPPHAQLHRDEHGRGERFFNVFYRVDAVKSGMHHPDGMLWIRTPEHRHRIVDEPVALESIAPTVLALLGIAAPFHMRRSPLPGFDAHVSVPQGGVVVC
jgi:hypothetical protein